MNNTITFTPSELFTMVIAICGAIVTVSAAITVIFKVITKVKEPETVQNTRLTKCEADIGNIYKKFMDYDMYFKRDKWRLDRLEDGNEVISEDLLALLSHAINGNDIDSLTKARNTLNEYLIKKNRGEQ